MCYMKLDVQNGSGQDSSSPNSWTHFPDITSTWHDIFVTLLCPDIHFPDNFISRHLFSWHSFSWYHNNRHIYLLLWKVKKKCGKPGKWYNSDGKSIDTFRYLSILIDIYRYFKESISIDTLFIDTLRNR